MALRLGKQEYKFDEKTVKLANFMSDTFRVPSPYDFDKGKSTFPLDSWGNKLWGNCVKVGQANHLIRLERLEQRRTVPMTAEAVIDAYKAQTGSQSPGDDKDNGLVVLENLSDWRKNGFQLKNRTYTIGAFGELDPLDFDQIRAANYLLHGVEFGFSLPSAAKAMTRAGQWDYKGEGGPEWASGSWGGHLVYGKMHDENHVEVITWGMKVIVSKTFVARYADEAWAVVDSLDAWMRRPEFDAAGLLKYLRDIGAKNIQ